MPSPAMMGPLTIPDMNRAFPNPNMTTRIGPVADPMAFNTGFSAPRSPPSQDLFQSQLNMQGQFANLDMNSAFATLTTPRVAPGTSPLEFGSGFYTTRAYSTMQHERLSLKWQAHQELEGMVKWLAQKLVDDSRDMLLQLQQKHVASIEEFLAITKAPADVSAAAMPQGLSRDPTWLASIPTTLQQRNAVSIQAPTDVPSGLAPRNPSRDPPWLGSLPTAPGAPGGTNLAAQVSKQLKEISARLDQHSYLLKNSAPHQGGRKQDNGAETSQVQSSPLPTQSSTGTGDGNSSRCEARPETPQPTLAQRQSTVIDVDHIEDHLELIVAGEEKQHHDRLEQIVHSNAFELLFGGAIILNTILMSMEMQYLGDKAAVDIEWPDAEKPADWIGDALKIADIIFLWLFTVELIAKMVCLRRKFWKDRWNWLDFLIVGFGLVESFVDVNVGLDPMMLRLLRLVKLVRFVKMFKMAGHLFVLNLIMKSVSTTISTLAWSMLLLFMLQAVCGIFVGQMVYSFLTDQDNDPAAQRNVYKYYGTFTRTMFTMFEITHVNYSRAARVLTDNISERWAWFFMGYRCFVSFAVLQVIRAVFIQQTLKVAENDKELLLMANERASKNLKKKLAQVFDIMDVHNAGKVAHRTFVKILSIPKMKEWMAALGIDPRDPEKLFQMIDINGSGEIDFDEFVTACSKMRGPAHSIDLFHMYEVCNRTEDKLDLLMPDYAKGHRPAMIKSKSVLALDSEDDVSGGQGRKRSIVDADMGEMSAAVYA